MRLLETFDEEDSLIDPDRIIIINVILGGKPLQITTMGMIKGKNYSRLFLAIYPIQIIDAKIVKDMSLIGVSEGKNSMIKGDSIRFCF